jgi:multiple sugar transport system substrate-binding protein
MLAGLTAGAVATLFPAMLNGRANPAVKNYAVKKVKELSTDGHGLRILIPHGCLDNIKPVIDEFTQFTGVSVDVTEAPVDAINAQITLDTISGNNSYDLALPATFGIPDLVSSKAIIPLSKYAKKHEPADFRDSVAYSTGDRFDDELYGYQTDGDTYLMFYNKDFLENSDEQHRYEDLHGELLVIPKTWDELDRQMAFFQRKDAGKFGGLLFRTPGYLAWEWWVRFHAKGYWPLSKTLEPQIDSDAGVEALEQMIEATQYLAPESSSVGLFENWERYSRGDIYCNIGWGGTQKYLNSNTSAMRGRMVYGPTPGGIVDNTLFTTPYFNWGWNYVVTSSSTQPELAYLFALFASTPEMSTKSVQKSEGFFDPFRAEHYEDPEIQRIYSKEFLAVHKASLESSIPDLYIADQSRYFQALNLWLDQAITGQVKPREALKRAAQEWNLIQGSGNHSKQVNRWLDLRAGYPESIRERLRDIS